MMLSNSKSWDMTAPSSSSVSTASSSHHQRRGGSVSPTFRDPIANNNSYDSENSSPRKQKSGHAMYMAISSKTAKEKEVEARIRARRLAQESELTSSGGDSLNKDGLKNVLQKAPSTESAGGGGVALFQGLGGQTAREQQYFSRNRARKLAMESELHSSVNSLNKDGLIGVQKRGVGGLGAGRVTMADAMAAAAMAEKTTPGGGSGGSRGMLTPEDVENAGRARRLALEREMARKNKNAYGNQGSSGGLSSIGSSSGGGSTIVSRDFRTLSSSSFDSFDERNKSTMGSSGIGITTNINYSPPKKTTTTSSASHSSNHRSTTRSLSPKRRTTTTTKPKPKSSQQTNAYFGKTKKEREVEARRRAKQLATENELRMSAKALNKDGLVGVQLEPPKIKPGLVGGGGLYGVQEQLIATERKEYQQQVAQYHQQQQGISPPRMIGVAGGGGGSPQQPPTNTRGASSLSPPKRDQPPKSQWSYPESAATVKITDQHKFNARKNNKDVANIILNDLAIKRSVPIPVEVQTIGGQGGAAPKMGLGLGSNLLSLQEVVNHHEELEEQQQQQREHRQGRTTTRSNIDEDVNLLQLKSSTSVDDPFTYESKNGKPNNNTNNKNGGGAGGGGVEKLPKMTKKLIRLNSVV